MQLLILTQYFPPEMGAPQARLSELGEELIDLGWKVEALTALPNYPTGKIFRGYNPTKPCVESIGRIRTARVPLFPAKNGFLRRLVCYFSFVASACRFGPRLCRKPDLLFVESPPLFIGYAARYLCRHWRCPYIFNVSDLWPESAVRMGIINPGWATRVAQRLEFTLYKKAAGVTGQSTEIIESIRSRAPDVRTEIITNGVHPSRFGKNGTDETTRFLVGSEPGPVFIFAGLLGLAQGLDQILDLAKSLLPEVPGRFLLVGDGPVREHLQTRLQKESIHRIKLVQAQPRERIPALLGAADAAIISTGPSIRGYVPSKIYVAMASSLPILLIADGEAAQRVQAAQCGIAVSPDDLVSARKTFRRLAQTPELRARMGAAGRRAAETIYDRKLVARKLDQFLRECLTGLSSPLPPL